MSPGVRAAVWRYGEVCFLRQIQRAMYCRVTAAEMEKKRQNREGGGIAHEFR